MVANSYLPNFRGNARQRPRGLEVLAQTIGRTAIASQLQKSADLTDMAAPEIGEVMSLKKKLESVAADVG